MPCFDARAEEYDKQTQERLNRITRLLCEACALLRKHNAMSEAGWELREWATSHENWDAQRKAQEPR